MSSYSQRFQHTLVIARYKEDISWIEYVPKNFRIFIYNKGKKLPLSQIDLFSRDRRITVIHRPNKGREAETYLHYLLERTHPVNPSGYTVFTQGNPFIHGPDFIGLLYKVPQWKTIQPLTYRYKKDFLPPQTLLDSETSEYIEGFKIRLEIFSSKK